MYAHNSGFRPGLEGMATHARRRYRLVPTREPVPNLPPMDPSLWLIHYYTNELSNQIPTRGIPISDHANRIMTERNSLQGHGSLQLQHKEFMLRDRENWPTVNPPGINAPSYPQQAMGYPNNVMAHMSRSQHPAYMQQTQAAMSQGVIGPSPAKRQRHVSNSHGHASATAIPMPVMPPDAAFDDEETTSGVDYMDVLTPQQISRSRYVQHHEWLEEVLNSPYDSHQIIPGALGLGRKGELESLTRDFFDAPERGTRKEVLELPRTPKEEDFKTGRSVVPDDHVATRVGRMEDGKAEDFTQRAAQRMADLQTEIDELKRQHSRRMAKISNGQSWREAERRLRVATVELMNNDASRAVVDQDDQIDQIIQTAEQELGKRIKPIEEVECIEKGGLEEKFPTGMSGNADMNMDGSMINANVQPGQPYMEPNSQVPPSSIHVKPTDATTQAVETLVAPQQPPADAPTEATQPQPGPKDNPADDWVMVNKDADAIVQAQNQEQDHDRDQDQDQSAFDSFTNDAAMQMDDTTDHVLENADDIVPTEGGLTFEDHDFSGGIDFGDLDTAGDELSGYAQEIQNMGVDEQQTLNLGDTSTGDAFQDIDAPPGQVEQAPSQGQEPAFP